MSITESVTHLLIAVGTSVSVFFAVHRNREKGDLLGCFSFALMPVYALLIGYYTGVLIGAAVGLLLGKLSVARLRSPT